MEFNCKAINLKPANRTFPIKLTQKGERALRKGHPWIFESSIAKQPGDISTGGVCIIFSRNDNKYLGLGLYDADSPIRIKVLFSGKKRQFDPDFLLEKLSLARQERSALFAHTNAYRWIHGENDQMPGLIIDQYADVTVIKLYSAIWWPYLDSIVSAIVAIQNPVAVVLRLARSLKEKKELKDGSVIFGQLEDPVVQFKEYGVLFSANVIEGHKTGYFLDHRWNRGEIGRLAKGKSVLDVFSYAGGFSVHALVGGARKVVSIDISKAALLLAHENAALNKNFKNHETRAGDAFELMKEAIKNRETYDIVVIDPPSFAKSKEDRERALNAYDRLAKLSIQLVAPKGILMTASCSSRISSDDFFETIESALERSNRTFSILNKTFHDVDHPIGFKEGAYLKSGYYQIK